VAASVGPYGAVLANGAEYTGDYDRTADWLREWHLLRLEVLATSGADLLAVETIPSIVEAEALTEALTRFPEVPAWVSFSCRDGARICDGTPFERAARVATTAPNVVAVGVNCTAPSHVASLVELATAAVDRPVVTYPNRGAFWDPVRRAWTDPPRQDAGPGLRPRQWYAAGARLIGGCCGTGPEDIRGIATALGR
jgi:homocysteine S-methyltransferase